MSDFPIQKDAPIQLPGGNNFVDRRGNEASQVFPNGGRSASSPEVNNNMAARTVSPNSAAGADSRPSSNVSGLNAGAGRAINVRPVDCLTVTGSTPGDHRAPSPDTAAASVQHAAVGVGSPRARVGQFPNGKFDSVNGAFGKDYGTKSFPGDTADSDAGN